MKNKKVFLLIISFLILSISTFSQDVTLLYKTGTTEKWTREIYPSFKFVNNTGTVIYLRDYTIRYYYTKDNDADQNFVVLPASTIPRESVSGLFADDYVEIGFTSEAGSLLPGEEVEVHIRIDKVDGTAYDQTDDYSYNETLVDYSENDRITLYRNSTLISGVPPTPQTMPTPDPSKATLTVIHEGNEHVYSTEVLEITPRGVYAGSEPGSDPAYDYWYEKGSVVRLEIAWALTPAPTRAGGEDYQTMSINGTKGPVDVVMDSDKTITIVYSVYRVSTPTPAPAPTIEPLLLHLNPVDIDASEEGPDIARITINEEWTTGMIGDGWMEYSYRITGSATNGIDYQELDGTVWVLLGTEMGPTPPPGEERNEITIRPIDDTVYEGLETVTITMNGYGSESVTINIADNDDVPPYTLGDVNNSGTIDIIDALLVAQWYVDLNPPDFTAPLIAADVNCDGECDIIDALIIAQYYVKIISAFCE